MSIILGLAELTIRFLQRQMAQRLEDPRGVFLLKKKRLFE